MGEITQCKAPAPPSTSIRVGSVLWEGSVDRQTSCMYLVHISKENKLCPGQHRFLGVPTLRALVLNTNVG